MNDTEPSATPRKPWQQIEAEERQQAERVNAFITGFFALVLISCVAATALKWVVDLAK